MVIESEIIETPFILSKEAVLLLRPDIVLEGIAFGRAVNIPLVGIPHDASDRV